jgi:Fur family ferric uptake transcriptional regulator
MRVARSVDRASVYRTVALFERLGIVQRLSHGWKYSLELTDRFSPHHHHLTCDNCGLSIAFEEPALFKAIIFELSRAHQFTADSHQLEIRGLCSSCSALKDPGK